MQDIMMEEEGILYAADVRQLNIMKLFSRRAKQNITYNCRNSNAWKTVKNTIHKTIKIRSDNDVDIHGLSKDKYIKPRIVLDECKVSHRDI